MVHADLPLSFTFHTLLVSFFEGLLVFWLEACRLSGSKYGGSALSSPLDRGSGQSILMLLGVKEDIL